MVFVMVVRDGVDFPPAGHFTEIVPLNGILQRFSDGIDQYGDFLADEAADPPDRTLHQIPS